MDRCAFDRRSFVKGATALGLAGMAGCLGCFNLQVKDAFAEEGKRIVIGRPVDSDNLDPVTCFGNANIFISNLIIEGLVKTSDDGQSIEPCLATDWEVSEDARTYTFHVAEGLVFSDGSPVTAADWQWTFDRAMQTTDSNWYSSVENIESVECPDDLTVVVTTKQAAASTLANLSIFDLGVQSKAYYEKVGPDEYKNAILGTGPFMCKEWQKGQYLTLAKNPNYRETGKPLADEVEFKVVADDNSRTIQLQGGDIDVATDVPFSTLSMLANDPNCMPHTDPSTFTYWISLNTANEYLSNSEVRRALFLATDAQQITDMTTYGFGATIGSIIASTSEYCDLSLPAPVADPEAAKQVLADAGVGPFSVNFMIRGGNDFYLQVATILQAQWAQIGVTVKIDQRESTAYTEARQNMEMDLIMNGWSDDIQDPSQLMQFCFDFDRNKDRYTNFVQPEEMQELNRQASIEVDAEKRKELYVQIQQGFRDQYIFIPLFTAPWQNAVRNDVSGFVQTPLGNYRFADLTK